MEKKLTDEEYWLINGSGLFFFKSETPDTLKLSILKWVGSLNN